MLAKKISDLDYPADLDLLLTDKEAGRMIHRSARTISRMKRENEIGSVQTPLGRKCRRRDVLEYVGMAPAENEK